MKYLLMASLSGNFCSSLFVKSAQLLFAVGQMKILFALKHLQLCRIKVILSIIKSKRFVVQVSMYTLCTLYVSRMRNVCTFQCINVMHVIEKVEKAVSYPYCY